MSSLPRNAAIVVLILGIGGGAAALLFRFRPEARQEERVKVVPEVEVLPVTRTDFPLWLESQGKVEPTIVTQAASEVAGRVVRVAEAFEAGGAFREGDVLVAIDDADYVAAVARAEAELAEARLALELEEARATQGERDWRKLGSSGEPPPLVARQPQLDSARARVSAASAMLEQAGRELERTKLKAPYDGRVRTTFTDLGSYVNVGSPLAELYSTERLEVRLPLSLEQYALLADVESPKVTLAVSVAGRDEEWAGRIVRVEGEVEEETRSIHLVARLEESSALELGRQSLLAPGLFVRAKVEGQVLQDVVVLPRRALFDGSQVLIVSDGLLEFRPIEVRHSSRDRVIVGAGLEEGESICMTPLATPTNGQEVRVIGTLRFTEGGELLSANQPDANPPSPTVQPPGA